MRGTDLNLKELLQVDPAAGILRFGNERVLLLDAVALGLLRRELIDTLGLTGARRVLGDSEEEWRHEGDVVHTLQAHVRVVFSPEAICGGPKPVGEWIWEDS